MTPERWEIISRIFNEAAALKPDERHGFIEMACRGDETLFAEVESLLSAHEEAGDFIENPIVENLVGDISEMPTLTGKYFGHYRVERSIGRGGMGDVYLATDTRLDRLVALKRLPERLVANPLFVKRFRTEARAAATIHHPNVATLFSVEEFEDRPFITMEYVDGQLLDSVTPPEGMAVLRFLDIFTQIADAMAHAHYKGVIHRDIKPGNIMITADGTPKILDFGLALFTDDSSLAGNQGSTITQPGQILGTPSYMSPEQAQGKNVDHRSDIFSLGVVMYEAITGRRPFTGDSNAELISNLLKSEPKAVNELRPDFPRAVSRLVAQCMSKKPSDRPVDMKEIRSVLAEARKTFRAGTSTGSFARRLYRESASAGIWLRLAVIGLVVVMATGAWYYFSQRSGDPPFIFEKMAMRRLTDTNNVGFAQVSPDGKSFVYATFESEGNRALWIRRIDDRNALQLIPPDRRPFWGGMAISPDGGQVFYLTADALWDQGTLFRVSSLGGPARKIAEPANDVGGVSPDGERILFVRYGKPSKILSIKALDGSDEQEILAGEVGPSRATNFRDPHFSKDGKSVFYSRLTQENGVEEWSLEQLDLDTREIRTIFRQPQRISEIAVLPPGRGLLVTATDPVSNLSQLFHVSLSDGKRTRLTNDLFIYFGVSVDNEGRNIVLSQRSDQGQVLLGNADDITHIKPLNQESNAYRNVEWTPDGRVLYDGYENNVTHIWISDADGRNLQKLTTGDSDGAQPKVSGDGRYIVFTSRRTGRAQLWRMGIDGSGQTLLTDVPGVTQAPKLSADGQTVYFEWLREGKASLARMPIAGGPIEEVESLNSIPSFTSYYWAASPDGKFIAHSIWDTEEQRIKVAVDAVSSGQRVTVLNIWPSLILKWMPDGKSIFYRERQSGLVPEYEVHKVDVATGRISQMISTAPEFVVDMSYSRDGRNVALVKGSNSSNAILLTPALNE